MNPLQKFLLFVAAPAVLVFALIEAVVLSRRQHYDWRAFGVSAFDLVARISVGLLLPLSIATPLVRWAYHHRMTTIQLEGWLAVLLLFVGQEFCYYGYHRAAHRVRWFWGNHAVHRSPNELNLSAAFRIGIFGKLTGLAVFFVPLIWLGFDPRTVFAVLSLNLLYQFWIHATWIPKQFAQWISLARDLAGARSLRAVFGHLFMPPGWARHGAGHATAELRAPQRQT